MFETMFGMMLVLAAILAIICALVWKKNRELQTQYDELKQELELIENRRQATRFNVGVTCMTRITGSGDPSCAHFIGQQQTGEILNISITGIKVALDLDVPVRKMMEVELSFEVRGNPCKLQGVIVRKEEYLRLEPKLVYGIRFADMDTEEKERLQLMINYLQTDQIKKHKGA